MPERRSGQPSCYRLLQVHPAAPVELITAVYWRLVGRAQVSSDNDRETEDRMRELSRAFNVLSDPVKRAAYDRSMRLGDLHELPKLPGGSPAGTNGDPAGGSNGRAWVDYYDLLRVDPGAEPPVIEEAYNVMRERYGESIAAGEAPPELLPLLDEAFQTTRNSARRIRYDAERPQYLEAAAAALPVARVAPRLVAPAAPLEQPRAADRDSVLFNASLVLSAVSALCILVGMATASLELTDYGIAKSFPLSFYLGLFLLPLASACLWFTNRKVDVIILVQLLLLLIAIWLSPYLLESTARFRSSYKNFSSVDWLLDGNGFEPDLVIYHNWPFFPVLMSGVMKVTGLSPTQMMGLFPFFIQIAYLFPLTYLLRVFRPAGNAWWAGVWFFYLFNWTGQDYFAPQAVAFLMFLSLLALFAHITARRDGYFSLPSMALVLGLFGCLALTHVLTAGIVVAIMIALTLSGQLKQRSVVVACSVMFVAWQIYGAASFFEFSQDRIEDNVLDLQDFFNLNVGSRLAGAPDHVVVGRLRMVLALVAGAVAAICFLMRVTERHDRRSLLLMRQGAGTTREAIASLGQKSLMYLWQPAPFAVFCFIALIAVAPLYVYGGEMLIRSLLLSLPAFALLVAGAFSWRTPIIAVVALMAVVAPLHMIARYGNELYDYVSPGEIEGFEYVSTLGPANIYGAYPAGTFENTRQLDWRYGIKPGKSKPPDADGYLRPDQHRWFNPDWPIYVAISRGDDAAAQLFYNQPQFIENLKAEIGRRCNFEPVFENEDFALYRWHETCESAVSREDSGG
jgi:DnaJ domain